MNNTLICVSYRSTVVNRKHFYVIRRAPLTQFQGIRCELDGMETLRFFSEKFLPSYNASPVSLEETFQYLLFLLSTWNSKYRCIKFSSVDKKETNYKIMFEHFVVS